MVFRYESPFVEELNTRLHNRVNDRLIIDILSRYSLSDQFISASNHLSIILPFHQTITVAALHHIGQSNPDKCLDRQERS